MVKRIWFAENGGVWQVDSQRNALGRDVELRRHMMCRVGAELALAYNMRTHAALRFGPRDMIERWMEETNRAVPTPRNVSLVLFLASAETVTNALRCWEQGSDVRAFVEQLRGVDRLHF